MARQPPPSRWPPSEHLRAIYSPPGRDLAIDGRAGTRWRCSVPTSACRAPAAGRLFQPSRSPPRSPAPALRPMASSVATPLERQLGQIPGVTEMTSFSALGATSVTLQFELHRTSTLPPRMCRRRSRLPGKTLPQTMTTPPTYKKLNPADAPILVLAARSDTLPLTQVDEYADSYLAQQISQVGRRPGCHRRRAATVDQNSGRSGKAAAAPGSRFEQVRGALGPRRPMRRKDR